MDVRGSMVALVTPFKDGAVDEASLRGLIQWQLAQGSDGLVPCGTTGEGATLEADEQDRVIRICVEESRAWAEAKGGPPRPVVAGCGSNSTKKTIENVRRARESGAHATLVVTPYYNKPTQEGLFRHYEAVAKEGGLPVVMYNIPGRAAVDLLPETVARLSRVPGIAGIKEASGNIVRVAEIREKAHPNFSIYAGDDMFTLPTLALGGQGVISACANVAPADFALVCDAFFGGNLEAARAAQIRLAPLVRAMFVETNPIPVKYALHKMGKIAHGDLRLPLTTLSPEAAAKVDLALRAYGAIS